MYCSLLESKSLRRPPLSERRPKAADKHRGRQIQDAGYKIRDRLLQEHRCGLAKQDVRKPASLTDAAAIIAAIRNDKGCKGMPLVQHVQGFS